MANTTFNGPVISTNGFIGTVASTNASSYVAVSTAPATNNVNITAAQMAGAATVYLNYTGTAGAAFTLTTDTAANIIAAIPNAQVGQQYDLRVINTGSGYTATLTAGTGVTINGTATIANNTWRDFYVVIATSSTVTLQSVGVGTQS